MVLVVFVHVKAPGIMSNSNLAGIGLYDMLRRAISLTLAQTAVPMFFFISGYLFFNRLHDWNWSVYLGKLRKRCKTLLVPFVLWNTIAIVALFLAFVRHAGFHEATGLIFNNDFCNIKSLEYCFLCLFFCIHLSIIVFILEQHNDKFHVPCVYNH